MVAQRDHVIADRVHQFHGRRALRAGHIGRALAEVARVHQDHFGALGLKGLLLCGHHRVTGHLSVHVVGVQDHGLAGKLAGGFLGGGFFRSHFLSGGFLRLFRRSLRGGSFLSGGFLSSHFLGRSFLGLLSRSLRGGSFLGGLLLSRSFLSRLLLGDGRVSRLGGNFFRLRGGSLFTGINRAFARHAVEDIVLVVFNGKDQAVIAGFILVDGQTDVVHGFRAFGQVPGQHDEAVVDLPGALGLMLVEVQGIGHIVTQSDEIRGFRLAPDVNQTGNIFLVIGALSRGFLSRLLLDGSFLGRLLLNRSFLSGLLLNRRFLGGLLLGGGRVSRLGFNRGLGRGLCGSLFLGGLSRGLRGGSLRLCLYLLEQRRHVVDGQRDAAVLDLRNRQGLAVQREHAVIGIIPDAGVFAAAQSQLVGAILQHVHHDVIGGVVAHNRLPGAQVGGDVDQGDRPAGLFALTVVLDGGRVSVFGSGFALAVVLDGGSVSVLGNGFAFAVVFNGRRVSVLGSGFVFAVVLNGRRVAVLRSGFTGVLRGFRRHGSGPLSFLDILCVVGYSVNHEKHNNRDQDKKGYQNLLVFE